MFVNRLTGKRQTQKPEDWDGHYIIGQESRKPAGDHLFAKTFANFTETFCTPMHDVVQPKRLEQPTA